MQKISKSEISLVQMESRTATLLSS